MRCLSVVAALALNSLGTVSALASTPEVMHPVELNGYVVLGAEYLPFVGNQPLQYPSDVLWGFYPNGASEAAKSCALAAYERLLGLFAEDGPDLHAAVAAGATPDFALWINDYSSSGTRQTYRPARLWHRGLIPADVTQGVWTYEVTLTRSQQCQQPSAAQISAVLRSARDAVGSKH